MGLETLQEQGEGAGQTMGTGKRWPPLVKDLAGLARVVTCRRKTAE